MVGLKLSCDLRLTSSNFGVTTLDTVGDQGMGGDGLRKASLMEITEAIKIRKRKAVSSDITS